MAVEQAIGLERGFDTLESVLIRLPGPSQTLSQERVVIRRAPDGEHLAATPGLELMKVRRSVPPLGGLRRMGPARDLPWGIAEADCYLVNEDGLDGGLTDEQLEELGTLADEFLSGVRVAEKFLAGAPDRRAEAQAGPQGRPVEDGAAFPGFWVLAEPHPVCKVGEIIRGVTPVKEPDGVRPSRLLWDVFGYGVLYVLGPFAPL